MELGVIEREATRRRRLASWESSLPAKFRPFLKPSRYKALYGGRGGMKSHFYAELLLRRCRARRTRWLCVREVQLSLKESVKQLLEEKIQQLGLESEFIVQDTRIITPYNGRVIFKGMQNHTAESVKSFEGFDGVWAEEAQTMSDTSLTLLRPTIRKPNSEMWFSWNPRLESDPVDEFFRKNPPADAIVAEVSYLDNPYASQVLLAEAELDRRRDPVKASHVWGGGYKKVSDAAVFTRWRVVSDLVPPADAALYHGGDWGFSIDPACGVRMWIDVERKRLCIDHEVYGTGVEIDALPGFFDSLGCEAAMRGADCRLGNGCRAKGHGDARAWNFIVDSARPETISYLKNHGYKKMVPSIKGAGSVEEGVKFIQTYDVEIHERCVNTIREFTDYSYVIDKQTGKPIPVLADKDNHVIDSIRYALEDVRRAKLLKGGLLK